MKKSSTFNLEQDMYDEIESYKETYNLSSRNVALERMLLERRIMLNMGAMQQTDVEKPKESDISNKFTILKDPQTGKEVKFPVNTKSIL